MPTFPFVTPKMLRMIELAKKDVAEGYSRSYSTEPGQVWLESDQGWHKLYDENEEQY